MTPPTKLCLPVPARSSMLPVGGSFPLSRLLRVAAQVITLWRAIRRIWRVSQARVFIVPRALHSFRGPALAVKRQLTRSRVDLTRVVLNPSPHSFNPRPKPSNRDHNYRNNRPQIAGLGRGSTYNHHKKGARFRQDVGRSSSDHRWMNKSLAPDYFAGCSLCRLIWPINAYKHCQ